MFIGGHRPWRQRVHPNSRLCIFIGMYMVVAISYVCLARRFRCIACDSFLPPAVESRSGRCAYRVRDVRVASALRGVAGRCEASRGVARRREVLRGIALITLGSAAKSDWHVQHCVGGCMLHCLKVISSTVWGGLNRSTQGSRGCHKETCFMCN